jgi:RimJ/RimL family protein N-acetyltransferase
MIGAVMIRLSGEHVVLRDERRSGDDEDMYRWLNMEEWAYFDHPDRPSEPVTREDFELRLKKREAGGTGRIWQTWQIDRSNGEHIGWANCYEFDPAAASVRLGICLPHGEHRGRGLGTEALGLLLDHLFNDKSLREVRMTTWTGNAPMIRCALKAGLREVSRSPHRAAVSVRGEPLERIDLAISWSEWESGRLAQE